MLKHERLTLTLSLIVDLPLRGIYIAFFRSLSHVTYLVAPSMASMIDWT